MIGRGHWEPKGHDQICSDHFEGGISIFELSYTPMNNYVKHTMKAKNKSAYSVLQYLHVCCYMKPRILMLVMTHGITHVHVPVWYDLGLGLSGFTCLHT
jgi:hypothetical protein